MCFFYKFLTFTINMQIRLRILSVISVSIIISIVLLVMSNLIQYHNFVNSFESIIEDKDNKMLLNYEQYIHTVESTVEEKTKIDLEFYRNLENMFFENLEGLELSTLLNEDLPINNIYEYNDNEINDNITGKCYDKDYLNCIIYKFYGIGDDYKTNSNFTKMKSYYNLIFPLLNTTLSENCIGNNKLKQYHNFQFYKKIYSENNLIGSILFFAGTKETSFDINYNLSQYSNTIQLNIIDYLLNLFYIIPNFNKKLDIKYILTHLNTEFLSVPQITSSKHILSYDGNIPYKTIPKKEIAKIEENNLSFESKIFNFKKINLSLFNITSNEQLFESINSTILLLSEKMEDLMIIKWPDRFFEILVNNVFEKYKSILNIFSILFSPYASIKENILKNISYFFDEKNGINLTKDILEKFSCMYIVKKELIKTESDYEKLNSFNITSCKIKFNDDFEEYLRNNQTEIDIFERKKVKVDLVQYDIEYTYFNYQDNGSRIDEQRKLNFDLSTSNNKDEDKYLNSFKIFQGIYPSNSINNEFSPFSYKNIIFINFYFTDLFSNYLDTKIIIEECYNYFFKIILLISIGIWALVFVTILIIVLKISHSISDPIDKLIQPVPMNDNSSKELNKYFKNISYTDDSTINELFILCKKLIVGGFKTEEEKQKKKNKKMNSYNNISLVKTNNMIFNEAELLTGEEKKINFFEEQKKQSPKNKFVSNLINHSKNDIKKLNYKVLSNSKIFGKFYQNNKKNLIKDKECFDILNNEMISLKKKLFDDNKYKENKHNVISIFNSHNNTNNDNIDNDDY